MRNRLKDQDPDALEEITHENFSFRAGELTGCLDLFAVCQGKSATKQTLNNGPPLGV